MPTISRTVRLPDLLVLAAASLALSACGDASDGAAAPGSSSAVASTPAGQTPTADGSGPAEGAVDLVAAMMVDGDADDLWGKEKVDSSAGMLRDMEPSEMLPPPGLFFACQGPPDAPRVTMTGVVRNHELNLGDGVGDQAYQYLASGDPADVEAAYDALAAAAAVCVDAPAEGDAAQVTRIPLAGDSGNQVAVRSSQDGAWLAVALADDVLVVVQGFGDESATESISDADVATIINAAVAKVG